MIGPLLSLAAGYLVFFLLFRLWEPSRPVRRFWVSRVFTALVSSVVLWKLTPLWTRWETVFSNPLLLISMNGGLAALLGGLFAFVTIILLSLFQVRREHPGTRRWSLLVPVAVGFVLAGTWNLVEPVVLPQPGIDSAANQILVSDFEGRKHTLADWKGKVVVVNFWATWCPPCLAELPELQAFTQKAPSGVVVLGVNLIGTEKEGEKGVIRFASQNKLTWTQLTDSDGLLQKAFSVTSIPTTVVLDSEGRVVDRREGAVDLFWLNTLEVRFASR